MESADFYFDEQRSRTIKLEWTKDLGRLNIYDNDELLHQHTNENQLRKGIVLKTLKGENLRIRLFTNPTRWEVAFGDRFLINSYHRAEEVVKGTSQIFYYVFLATLTFVMVQFLPQYRAGLIGWDALLEPGLLISLVLVFIFYVAGVMVKRGKLLWYYVGTSLYLIDTVYVFVYTFVVADLPISALLKTNIGMILFALLLIRIVFAYYLINAFKHAVEFQKHKQEWAKKKDSEILDV